MALRVSAGMEVLSSIPPLTRRATSQASAAEYPRLRQVAAVPAEGIHVVGEAGAAVLDRTAQRGLDGRFDDGRQHSGLVSSHAGLHRLLRL